MKTHALALLALVLALPGAAAAQSSDLTFYGSLMEFGDAVATTGATATTNPVGAAQVPTFSGATLPRRARLTSGTSNLGFKGQLELVPGLKAIFQVESAVSPDGDAPNAWASRNSQVGLSGEWGTAFYGLWDTPYKAPILMVGPLRGLNPFDNAITANPGFNVPGTTTQTGRANAKADASFNRRQGNSLQYWSPKFHGLSARVAYGFDESRTAKGATAAGIGPRLYSALLSYDLDTLGVRYGYERHVDYFGLAQLGGNGPTFANGGSTDQAHELVAFYGFPTGTKLSAIVERLSYENRDTAAGAVKSYTRDSFYVLAQQRFGAHQVWGSYGKGLEGDCKKVGGAACSTDGLSGTQMALGYSYSITKSFDVFAAWYRMVNGTSASYSNFPPVGTVAPGADVSGFGVGLLYTFSGSFVKPEPPAAAPAAPAAAK
ncbi:MAG: porin [Anaeromyxobacter sp.]